MGWVTLTLRKATLRQEINELELRDIQISREVRSIQKDLAREKSIFEANKTTELRAAKSTYDSAKNKDKPAADADVNSDEYVKWQDQWQKAKIAYEDKKYFTEEYYNAIFSELEEEATDKQAVLEDEQTTVEAQLQSVRSELETVNEQIKSDISSSKLTLS